MRQGPEGQDREGHLGTEWAVIVKTGGLGRACLPGTSPALLPRGAFLRPRPDGSKHPSSTGHPALC